MAIYRFDRFQNDVEYYTGVGCLVCGTNLGACIDLGVYDSIEGAIALCEDHARECGVHAGMVAQSELDVIQQNATAQLEQASADRLVAAQLRAEAEEAAAYVRKLIESDKAKAKPATKAAK